MTVASMTGFARAEGQADGSGWVWEIKSVNSKSLDLRFRLPPGYDGIEPPLRAQLAERLKRGAVSVNLTITRNAAAGVLRVNRTALAEIMALAKELGAETGAAPPRLDGLLAPRDDRRIFRFVGAFEHAAQRQQPVEPRRRGTGLGAELLGERHDFGKRRAVDPQYAGGGVPGDRKIDGNGAALQALGELRAQRRLDPIIARRQAKAEIERLAVDAFDLPHPAGPVGLPLGARESSHAGDGHRISPTGEL